MAETALTAGLTGRGDQAGGGEVARLEAEAAIEAVEGRAVQSGVRA